MLPDAVVPASAAGAVRLPVLNQRLLMEGV
jgi:hypothetical protein